MALAIDKAIDKLDAILARLGQSPSPSASSSSPALPAVAQSVNGAAAGKAEPGARQLLVNSAQIKVAQITSVVKQPNSSKLLKMAADLGSGDTRQIMAGLQQYLSPADLQGRLVCVVSNLKPAKLAGEPSEAMVLAASCCCPGADGAAEAVEVVRPLVPPEGAQPGDLVHLDGCCPPAAYPKVLKLDDWRKVAPGLVVQGSKATFEGTPLMTSSGVVTVPPEIAEGAAIR